MTHGTMHFLELWVGRPACALLTLHRRVRAWLAPRPSTSGAPERILFIKLIEQGSTVLAYGALKAAADLVGRANVYFLVFGENREIVDLLDVIPPENVVTIDPDRPASLVAGSLAALAALRRLRIDTVIDLEHFSRASAILGYLSGAARRVGLHRFTNEGVYRGDLMTHRVAYNPYVHTADAYRLLVHALSEPSGDVPLLKVPARSIVGERASFAASEAERGALRGRLEECAGRRVEGRIVILNPNANDRLPLRRWPTERFVEIGKRILATWDDVELVITGAAGERAAAERVRESIGSPRVTNLAGRTTLREAIVLYTLGALLVTNDSGPAHFASMAEIDIVALFGPETPLLYGPLGPRSHVFWEALACSPCVSPFNNRVSACRNNVCMQSIDVERVFAAIQQCLEGGRSPRAA
jgi:ADP-heptose:LPS heptosyltransferase